MYVMVETKSREKEERERERGGSRRERGVRASGNRGVGSGLR